jgi:cysteine-rich repeat protein
MVLRNHTYLFVSLVAAGTLSLAACSDDATNPATDTGMDAGTDGSGAGDITSDTTVDPDGAINADTSDTTVDPDGAINADTTDVTDPDGGEPDTDTIDPTDGSTEGDTETDGSASDPQCGDGVVEGVELCDDDNDDETDGCLSDCRTTAALTGEVVLDRFAVAGVTITATLGDEVVTTTTSEEDGSFALYLPAGEWTLEASLSEFEIVTDDSPFTSEGSGAAEAEFTIISTTVAPAPDAYGPSSFAEPLALPSEEALQFRTFDTHGDGDWFIIDTEETGPIGLFTINLGAYTDTRFYVYDAATFVLGSEDNEELDTENGDDHVYVDSLIILPLEESDVTEYVVFLGNYDDPCGLGTYFLGAASGDELLDVDEDGIYGIADCDDDNDEVYPNQDEDFTNDIDDNCDGYVAPREYVDYELNNLTRETAYALTAGDARFAYEQNILKDRFADLTLDALQGATTHWYSVSVPASGSMGFDWSTLVSDCEEDVSYYWDDESGGASRTGGLNFFNDTDAARTLYVEFSTEMNDGVGGEPAEWCMIAPFISTYGVDADGDGFASEGYGDDRDLDDADDTVGSCGEPVPGSEG